eukprot:gene19647-biopygen797
MNSCHEEDVRDRNRAGIEATFMLTFFYFFPNTDPSSLDSGREHPPREMSSSQTGYCMVESMNWDVPTPSIWQHRAQVLPISARACEVPIVGVRELMRINNDLHSIQNETSCVRVVRLGEEFPCIWYLGKLGHGEEGGVPPRGHIDSPDRCDEPRQLEFLCHVLKIDPETRSIASVEEGFIGFLNVFARLCVVLDPVLRTLFNTPYPRDDLHPDILVMKPWA